MRILILLLASLLLFSCARKGMITGGPIDSLPPVLKYSEPKNSSVNFNAKEIKLYFDEYVKLKDVNKQLIVSPPMNTAPEITPMAASKTISIKLKDTLLPNTTYSLNFGQSIQDNNEGNPFSQFTYLFSTGTYIDSLEVGGSMKDAFGMKPDNFVSILLYEFNDTYTDSIIFKEKPLYVTNTLDSSVQFRLKNLKEGTYKLFALKDKNNNYKFDPKTEKIGFIDEPIQVPTTETFQINLFQEELPFKPSRAIQSTQHKLWLGYEGNPKEAKIVVRQDDKDIPVKLTQETNKDSIQIWLPKEVTDSLKVLVNFNEKESVYKIKHRKMKADTLSISSLTGGILHFRDEFKLKSTIPLKNIDTEKISIIKSDSSLVAFKHQYDEWLQEIKFDFEREPSEKYSMTLLNEALTDIYEKTNDSLKFTFSTRKLSDYGNLTLNLVGVSSYPLIVDLTDNKGKLLATQYVEKEGPIEFKLLQPALFTVRLIYDTNKNKIWDTGNYLQKVQPEVVIYLQKPIDVRANWDVTETITIRN
ncbi:MAG: Ig-like domain-containing protein [Flavobacterium sp.]